MQTKAELRRRLKAERRAEVAALDPRVRALVMMRPPAPLLALVPQGATVGLYVNGPDEVPTRGYARFLNEAGHRIALPWFAGRGAPMAFRHWQSPHIDELLETGPYGVVQPQADAGEMVPEVLFVPLVGFSARGGRLGQGGGHYDRWMETHPDVPAIGMAWDCQLVDDLPIEAHDRPLAAVVTPTRIYGPF